MDIPTHVLPLVAPRLSPSQQRSRWKITALGGGHGLHASLRALRLLDADLTAVVTVADDGGSSGRIRDEFGVLPPGDLRMALSALCDDSEWGRTWARVMQHRFTTLPDSPQTMEGHVLGNFLIVTLWEMLGDAVEGLEWAGQLLGARGRVLPMSTDPLRIRGTVVTERNGQLTSEVHEGQVALAKAAHQGSVTEICLLPEEATGTPQALEAIREADWNVLGPGSWYTSVLPHLLLEDSRKALSESKARTLVTMNLTSSAQEASGLKSADHLKTLARYAPELHIDAVLADPSTIDDRTYFCQVAENMGTQVFFDRVESRVRESVHDPLRLAAAYKDVFSHFESNGAPR